MKLKLTITSIYLSIMDTIELCLLIRNGSVTEIKSRLEEISTCKFPLSLIYKNDYRVVKNAILNSTNSYHISPLRYACNYNYVGSVKLFLSYLDHEEIKTKASDILPYVIEKCHINVVRAYLSHLNDEEIRLLMKKFFSKSYLSSFIENFIANDNTDLIKLIFSYLPSDEINSLITVKNIGKYSNLLRFSLSLYSVNTFKLLSGYIGYARVSRCIRNGLRYKSKDNYDYGPLANLTRHNIKIFKFLLETITFKIYLKPKNINNRFREILNVKIL